MVCGNLLAFPKPLSMHAIGISALPLATWSRQRVGTLLADKNRLNLLKKNGLQKSVGISKASVNSRHGYVARSFPTVSVGVCQSLQDGQPSSACRSTQVEAYTTRTFASRGLMPSNALHSGTGIYEDLLALYVLSSTKRRYLYARTDWSRSSKN